MTVTFKLHECFPGVRYIVTDTSMAPMAKGMHIVHSPRLQATSKAGATGRTNVFGNGVKGSGPRGVRHRRRLLRRVHARPSRQAGPQAGQPHLRAGRGRPHLRAHCLQAIRDTGTVQPGQQVLISGAAGGGGVVRGAAGQGVRRGGHRRAGRRACGLSAVTRQSGTWSAEVADGLGVEQDPEGEGRACGRDIPRSPRPARRSGCWPRHPEEPVGRVVPRVQQLDPQLTEGHVMGGVEPDDDGEQFEHILARLDPGVDHG
jgi:hypothetical protein